MIMYMPRLQWPFLLRRRCSRTQSLSKLTETRQRAKAIRLDRTYPHIHAHLVAFPFSSQIAILAARTRSLHLRPKFQPVTGDSAG
eukprot:6210355-Pleurochrysis_carterae.AAC.3